jgi:hypothetical protein
VPAANKSGFSGIRDFSRLVFHIKKMSQLVAPSLDNGGSVPYPQPLLIILPLFKEAYY